MPEDNEQTRLANGMTFDGDRTFYSLETGDTYIINAHNHELRIGPPPARDAVTQDPVTQNIYGSDGDDTIGIGTSADGARPDENAPLSIDLGTGDDVLQFDSTSGAALNSVIHGGHGYDIVQLTGADGHIVELDNGMKLALIEAANGLNAVLLDRDVEQIEIHGPNVTAVVYQDPDQDRGNSR